MRKPFQELLKKDRVFSFDKVDIEHIKNEIKQCYSENPLQFWEKNQITAKLEMKDKYKEIRIKPMR